MLLSRLRNGYTSIKETPVLPFSSVILKLAPLTLLLVILQLSLITVVSTSYYLLINRTTLPNNALGHYVENTSDTEKLVWIEIYKSDRVADISLAQWLALTPADTVANTLKVDIEVVKQIKKEKQLIVKGSS